MTIERRKICLVGGEDVHKRINLSKYLIEAGFEVTIIGTSSYNFPDYIRYENYPLQREFSLLSDLKTIQWYKEYFTNNSFDLIHTFDTKPAFLLPIALRKQNTPVSRTITGLGKIFMKKGLSSFILKTMYQKLHKSIRKRVVVTVFQNTDDQDYFIKNQLADRDQTTLILSSGIELKDISKVAARKNNPYTFICVSRLVFEKGIINFLEAAKTLKSQGFDYRFLLVGPLEENSERLNQSILDQYQDVVEILGSRTDVMDLLCQSDAFVLPTFYGEGFPRVLLEAAAVGLPIISTKVTGVTQYVYNNKEAAILIEPNQTNALVEAMKGLAENKYLNEDLSKIGLEHVKQFGLDKISKEYITIFETAINQRKI